MNKKSLEKTYENAKSFLEKASQDILAWLKKHKKLVIVGTALYLAFTYLFEEDQVEDED